MPHKNIRLVSLRVLDEIFKNGAYGSIALSAELDKDNALSKKERAFITEITNGVLRNLTLIDYVIAQFSSVPAKKMKPSVLNVLRQATYEIMFMNTADYAICSEAVKTAKARGFSGLSGFINGVLRSILRNKGSIILPDEKAEPAQYLSIAFSHPKWLVEKWIGYYGYEFAKQMLKANNEPPGVAICANTLKIDAGELARELLSEGVESERIKFAKNALILKNPGSIKQLSAYKKGLLHVQDAASQIAVEVFSPRKGETIIDLCAAPGGKSFLSAYLMENTGTILASDIHAHKTQLVCDGAERLGIKNIKTKTSNAAEIDNELIGKADGVIIDAPCSGLGVIRKKPDIKLNRSQEDIKTLQAIQRNILQAGAAYVKKGGSLLYSTCTLTAEENEENAEWFLENFDFDEADISGLIHNDLSLTKKGRITLFPHIHNTDGFFMCKFIKRG